MGLRQATGRGTESGDSAASEQRSNRCRSDRVEIAQAIGGAEPPLETAHDRYQSDALEIAGVALPASRLLVGTESTGMDETRAAISKPQGQEIVTVRDPRSNIGQNPNSRTAGVDPPDRYTILPIPLVAYTAEDAVAHSGRLARELLDATSWSSWRSCPTRKPCSQRDRKPSRPPKCCQGMARLMVLIPVTTRSFAPENWREMGCVR